MILVIAYGVGRFVVVFSDSLQTGQRDPYVQMQTADSVVIRWLTEKNEFGVIRYGEDSGHMASVELEESPRKKHSLKLTNLKPATRYYYQVGEINGFHEFDPEKHWFYTHPVDVVPTRIWVMGDSGQPGETVNQVRDAALGWMKENPLLSAEKDKEPVAEEAFRPLINIWIALGDIAYRSGSNEQFQASLFDTFEDLVPNTSLWPVYGNHDDRRWTYFRIFDLPENAEAGGVPSHTENYYSIDYSNIHLLMLDTQDSGLEQTGKMANWLKNDLAKNSRPWVIAAFHHPPYTRGSHDSDDDSDSDGRMREVRENILPILEKAGVDVVLSGHSHLYERSYLMDCAYETSDSFSEKNIVSTGVNKEHKQYIKPLQPKGHQGTVYIVAGSSSKVDNGDLDHPAHTVGLAETGSVVIDVIENKLVARFINNKGLVKDEFSISKDAEFVSEYQGCQ